MDRQGRLYSVLVLLFMLVVTYKAQALPESKVQPKVAQKPVEKAEQDNKAKTAEKKETPKKSPLRYVAGDSEFKFSTKLRLPELFYGRNIRLLNDGNPTDQVLYARHTLDLYSEYRFGQASRGYDVVLGKLNVRNKGVWGDPESISPVTDSEVRALDAVFGNHRHFIARHIFWIRELWLQFSVSDLLGIPTCNYHTLTMGAFPFELGYGISLGTAYATDATDLGYFSESAIDQYAFGAKLSGDLVKDRLTYDLYAAILNNKSATFDNVNASIRSQQYGHRNDPARGFGVINYVVASRLRWRPIVAQFTKVEFEPYILYNSNPEQKIEFIGDSESKLATIGLSGDFVANRFDFGFDTALNFGRQKVFGFDRNIIVLTRDDTTGALKEVNKRVLQSPVPGKIPTSRQLAPNVSSNQPIINAAPQSAAQNGKLIETDQPSPLGDLYNDSNRFTDPYTNIFRGSMFVFDMNYRIPELDLKLSSAVGFASGDRNPNRDEEFPGDSEFDDFYDGFIGLQESFSGKRVKSYVILSGVGRAPRPLAFPTPDTFEPFPTTISRFSNLLFTGAGVTWRPCWSCRKWDINPNVLAFWVDRPLRSFNGVTQANRFTDARRFLGTEFNLFFECELLPDLRFFGVTALFVPGTFYKDIKGRPLNKAQQEFNRQLEANGNSTLAPRVPFLGTDTAYFLNLGLEYRY